MTKQIGQAWDILETTNYQTLFTVQVQGNLDVMIDLNRSSLYSQIARSRDTQERLVYMVYEWNIPENRLIIHSIGTFSDCCRMVEVQ